MHGNKMWISNRNVIKHLNYMQNCQNDYQIDSFPDYHLIPFNGSHPSILRKLIPLGRLGNPLWGQKSTLAFRDLNLMPCRLRTHTCTTFIIRSLPFAPDLAKLPSSISTQTGDTLKEHYRMV